MHVNLPVSYIRSSGGRYVEMFIEHEIRPEIGLDAEVLDNLPASAHADTAKAFLDAGLTPSVHLPFEDLLPGARDPLIRKATLERLLKAFEIAALYRPAHMIGHAVYWEPFYLNDFNGWLESSVATWREALEKWPGHPPLYVENVFETSPEPLARLMEALGGPGIGLCLDAGHWYSFGQGAQRRNLRRWVDVLAPWLKHLHLHDNDGSTDQHLGLGKGQIPWSDLFSLLAGRGLSPTITLEPHDEQSFKDSAAFIAAHPEWFGALS